MTTASIQESSWHWGITWFCSFFWLTWAESWRNLSWLPIVYCPSVCKLFKFIFFSITTRRISTRLGTQHPLVKGIQVCSNERSHSIPRGDNNQIIKLHWQHLNIFFFSESRLNQTWWKVSFGERDPSLFKWRATPFSKGRWLQLLTNLFAQVCLFLAYVSLVSNVAHGPLVFIFTVLN